MTIFYFFFGGVTGNRDRKFWYCSRNYVRNWFTLLNEQNPLLDFEGTRFVNELWKKKKKSPYLLTHRWNGGSGAGNEHIIKGGLIYFNMPLSTTGWLNCLYFCRYYKILLFSLVSGLKTSTYRIPSIYNINITVQHEGCSKIPWLLRIYCIKY